MSYNEYFTERLSLQPFEYQESVGENILNGKNVILSVPTGAGKTWASIMPFLFAQEHRRADFPSKMIYSLPLRALTNSIYEDVKKVCSASIQTGEYSTDKYFENDIIFSTIDQTLSNFLCFPLPLSHAQANINAGALIGSYLVFDEFHLLDKELSMATTLGMLKILGNLCRCCIMTATLSEDFMSLLEEKLPNYEIITLDDFPEDRKEIGSLKPELEKKIVNVINEPLSAQKIIETHNRKTIVICNRVESAQKIYNDLKTLKANHDWLNSTEIICLHSRFFDKDRKAKEVRLKNLFGKKSNEDSAILIATQVIEAGMDISCETMHTEISPVNSFLQRAGRCARFSDETGNIFVYDVLTQEEQETITIEPENKEDKEEIRKLNSRYLPYEPEICKKTYFEIGKYSTLDGDIPKQLIEAVLGKTEKDIISKMDSGQGGGFNQAKIRESWNTCQKNLYRNTIRDIQSVEVVLVDEEMEQKIPNYPYLYQSIGIYKWSLAGWLKKITKGQSPVAFDEDDWLIKVLNEAEDIFLENDENVKFELKKINPQEFKSIPAKVFLNPKYFGYSPEFGFNWQYADTFNQPSPPSEWKEKTEAYGPLKKDTFYQHNKGLILAFEHEFLGEKRDKLDFTFRELSKLINAHDLNRKGFIQLIKLMIVIHDYGKLNENWQLPMRKYQAFKENVKFEDFKEILAHTDFDSNNEHDKELAKKSGLNNRPPHAGVGAFATQQVFSEENVYLKTCISRAIARHHSPLADNYPDFTISEKNYDAMELLLKEFNFKQVELERKDYRGNLEGFEYDGDGEYLLYFFLVRILRLCDQKATENLSKYLNMESKCIKTFI